MSTNILVIGGTGSWGKELTRQLLETADLSITVLARNEANIVKMSRDFPTISCTIGDVRNYSSMYKALEGIDVVFHLAALKHVPICEEQPTEAIEINILGSLNVVEACKARGIKEAILISTDKAVEPVNSYGISKAMAEKLFLNYGYKVIRAGNVIGTSGSVIPIFKDQITKGKECTITSKEMTRFFITLEQAIGLIISSYKLTKGGEIAVINMPSFLLTDIIKVLSDREDYPTIEIGIRSGEKLHEILISETELLNTRYLEAEDVYIISPGKESNLIVPQLSSKFVNLDLTFLKSLLQAAGY